MAVYLESQKMSGKGIEETDGEDRNVKRALWK